MTDHRSQRWLSSEKFSSLFPGRDSWLPGPGCEDVCVFVFLRCSRRTKILERYLLWDCWQLSDWSDSLICSFFWGKTGKTADKLISSVTVTGVVTFSADSLVMNHSDFNR